jgi:hypothetical protein
MCVGEELSHDCRLGDDLAVVLDAGDEAALDPRTTRRRCQWSRQRDRQTDRHMTDRSIVADARQRISLHVL